MESSFLYRQKTGITMIFVLMFMIVASIIGNSLMHLSSSQSEIGGDYYAKKTADEAAESALDWFEGAVEDFSADDTANITKIISWMNNFDNSKFIGNRWFSLPMNDNASSLAAKDITENFNVSDELGASYIELGDNVIKAKLKIESVDRANRIVVVKAVGFGASESKKTLRAVYKLEGLTDYSYFQTDTLNNPGAVIGHAYYTDSKMGTTGNVDFDITGNNVYLGGLGSDGSEFQSQINIEGDLKVMGGVHMTGGGGGTVSGNMYVKGDFLTQSSSPFTVGTNSDASYCFIEGELGARSKGGIYSGTNTYIGTLVENKNGEMIFSKDLYVNVADYSDVKSEIIVAGDFYGDHTESEASGFLSNLTMSSGASPIWSSEFPDPNDVVKDATGGDATLEEEEIDIDVPELTAQASFSLEDILQSAANYDTEKISLTASQVSDLYYTGTTKINDNPFPTTGTIPGWSSNENERFESTNGVMVINFNEAYNNLANKFGSDDIAPGVKVAMAINDEFKMTGQKFWSASDPTSAIGFFCNPSDNGSQVGTFSEFRSLDVIHGMFYSSVEDDTKSNQFTNQFSGAVILKGEEIKYNSANGDMTVEYNDDVVRAFAGINNDNGGSIFLDPNKGDISYEYEDYDIQETEYILEDLKTKVVKPKMISKY